MNNKEHPVVSVIKDMLSLVGTINSQASDNPKLAKTVLGSAIVRKAQQIYQRLKTLSR